MQEDVRGVLKTPETPLFVLRRLPEEGGGGSQTCRLAPGGKVAGLIIALSD